MNIKDLFEKGEEGKLTYEQFDALAKESGAKFKDLSDGQYVSKSKYEADLKSAAENAVSLETRISELNSTIATRDEDLANLQKQLEEAGADSKKLAEVSNSFTDLQAKYDKDIKDYQSKMEQQAYEFAVKDYTNTLKFSSKAAKRDFTNAMIARRLQMEGNKLIGADDFRTVYAEENDDAFYKEPEVVPEPTPVEPAPAKEAEPVPTIVASTQGAGKPEDSFGFHFTGVRAKE